MLLAIRDRATGWIAWIIVILLIIPFALWGIQEYLGGGSEPVVATVEGREITKIELSEQVERVLRDAQERPVGEQAAQLRREVLDSMIAETVVVETARDDGMRIPAAQVNASIRQVPAFQTEGNFDQQRYVQVLSANRIDPEQFWAQQRRDLLRQQLLGAVGESAFATKHDIDEFIRLRDRQVKLSYVSVAADKFKDEVEVSAEALQRYYDEHPAQFKSPEQVKLKYLKLDPQVLADSVAVSEQQLRQMFDERKDSLFQPEQLQAAHILIAVPKDADQDAVDAARSRAEELRKRIAAGEDFAQLARQHSDDQASAEQGGDIGTVTPGSRDEAFELALAELEEGAVSEPVRTAKGFEIIKLSKRIAAGRPTFDQARDRLEQEYRRQQVEERFYSDSETLYDLTYENPLSLDVAAKALDLQVQESDWLTRKGAKEGLGAQAEVMQEAFSEELLAGGNLADAVNSKLVELKSGDEERALNPVVVFRVSDYRPAELKPFDQVREQIAVQMRGKAARDKAAAMADELLSKLKGGAKLETAARDAGLEVVQAGFVARSDGAQPASVVEAAFALGKPAGREPRFGTAQLAGGGTAVVAVDEVRDGDPDAVAQQEREFIERLLVRANGMVEAGAMIDDMRERADVSVDEEVLRKGDEN